MLHHEFLRHVNVVKHCAHRVHDVFVIVMEQVDVMHEVVVAERAFVEGIRLVFLPDADEDAGDFPEGKRRGKHAVVMRPDGRLHEVEASRVQAVSDVGEGDRSVLWFMERHVGILRCDHRHHARIAGVGFPTIIIQLRFEPFHCIDQCPDVRDERIACVHVDGAGQFEAFRREEVMRFRKEFLDDCGAFADEWRSIRMQCVQRCEQSPQFLGAGVGSEDDDDHMQEVRVPVVIDEPWFRQARDVIEPFVAETVVQHGDIIAIERSARAALLREQAGHVGLLRVCTWLEAVEEVRHRPADGRVGRTMAIGIREQHESSLDNPAMLVLDESVADFLQVLECYLYLHGANVNMSMRCWQEMAMQVPVKHWQPHL